MNFFLTDCGQPPGDGAASRSCLAHIWSQYEAWLFQEKQGPASDSLQKDSDRAVPLNWPEGRQRAAYGSKSKEAKEARQSRCPKAGERSLRIQTGARAAAGNELGLQGLIRNNLFVFWVTTNIFLCLKFKSTDHHIICSILFFFKLGAICIYSFLSLYYVWCSSVSAQSCPALCDTTDCNPPGSSVHGIFQGRILEWVATSYSRGSSWPKNRTQVSFI